MPDTVLQLIFDVIDLRSFSNLWFWVALACFWSMMSYFTLGVPTDMLRRAAKDPLVGEDVTELARIHILRLVTMADRSATGLVFVAAMLTSLLGVLAVFYRHEFSQALLVILLPLALHWGLTLRRCARIVAQNPDLDGLLRHLRRLRFQAQVIGALSILIASIWGMWVNLSHFFGA